MSNIHKIGNNTWSLKTQEANKVSDSLRCIAFCVMATIATPAAADGIGDNNNNNNSAVSQYVLDISQNISVSKLNIMKENSLIFIKGISNLYRKSSEWKIVQKDLIDFYSTYIIASEKSFPSITEYMRGEILSLFQGMLENGYTTKWIDEVNTLTIMLQWLKRDTKKISYGLDMPEDPNFTREIIVTRDKDFLNQAQRNNISQADTVKLKGSLEKVFSDILDALLQDWSISPQESDYLLIVGKEQEARRLLREANTDSFLKDARIYSIKKEVQDLQELWEQKDKKHVGEISEKNKEIAIRDEQIQALENTNAALVENIESIWSGIPKELLASVRREANLDEVITTLISILEKKFQNEKDSIKEQLWWLIENKDNKIQALSWQVESLTKDVKDLNTQLWILDTQLQKSQNTRSQLESQIADLKKAVENSKKQAKKSDDALADLLLGN